MSDTNLFETLGLDMTSPATVELVRDAVMVSSQVENLRVLRLQQGLSVEQVAERMGIAPDALAAIETPGSNPRLSTIRRYALAIGVVQRYTVHPIVSSE